MSKIFSYKEFVQNNPKGYWFKRKLYGFGWTPVRWQGWLATLVYIGALFLFSFRLSEESSGREVFFRFGIPAILLTALFIVLAYKKGEKPKWQWGPPQEDERKDAN